MNLNFYKYYKYKLIYIIRKIFLINKLSVNWYTKNYMYVCIY